VGSAFGYGEQPPTLQVDVGSAGKEAQSEKHDGENMDEEEHAKPAVVKKPDIIKGGLDEYEWMWKPELETTRRTFFL